MDKITYIPLGEITANKMNLRSDADKNNLEELADSIKAVGLINPITVRSYTNAQTEETNFSYEIISGERRFKAAEIAGLETIPAIVRNLDDNQTMEIIITENLQRKDTNPLDEAGGFNWLLNTGRYTVEGIADKIGKPITYVTKRLKFIQLSDEVRDKFRAGEITIGHALEFARLNEKQQEKMVKWMENHKYSNPTAKSLKDAIQQTFYLKIKDAVFDVDDDLLLEDLPGKHKYFGVLSCQMCPKRTGFNTNLFDDFDGDDNCTDPECFETKVKAHIEKTKSTYGEKGKPIIEYQHIDAQPSKEHNGVFTKKSDLVIISKDVKKCDSAVSAIVTKVGPYNYDFNKQVGDIIKVCKDPECKVHKRSKSLGSSSSNEAANDKQTAENQKKYEKARFDGRVKDLAEAKAVVMITKKLKYPLDDLILNDLIDTIIDQWDIQKYMIECKLMDAKDIEGFDFDKYLSKKSNLDRMKFLIGYMLYENTNLALKLYKKYRVDMAKLKKEARAELKLKEKNQAKAADMEIPENDGYQSIEEDED